MGFFENVTGFIVQPYKQTQNYLADLHDEPRRALSSFFFVVYGAIICGFVFVFWTFIPERLYYPVPYIDFNQLAFIELSTPLFLFIMFLIGFFLVLGVYFVAVGLGNYVIVALLSKHKISKSDCRNYLAIHGFSILPLLFLGIFTIFWIYFFEKIYFTQTFPPFLDFTRPMIIFFTIFILFLGWHWVIELRVNQAFFEVSVVRAIIPELVQIAMFWGFLIVLQVVVNLFIGNMEWV